MLIAMGIGSLTLAQTRTADYIQKLPELPEESCNITRAAAEDFEAAVAGLEKQLQEEIRAINKRVDTHMKANEGNARDNTMKQMSEMYGISQEDLEKMKNSKNMTAAEKQALANKMMSQQTNMTVDDAQSLGKMSEAGKKAYAEAYAMEAMATHQADPNQEARNKNVQSMYQSVVSLQAANSKVSEVTNKIAALYTPLESDPERQKMLDRMDAWYIKRMSMTGVDYGQGKQMDSLALLIKNEKIAYCNKYTPKYRAALRKHLEIIKSSMPDYQSLGNLTVESTKAQSGIEMPAEGREIPALGAIDGYLEKLEAAYQFKLYFAEDE